MIQSLPTLPVGSWWVFDVNGALVRIEGELGVFEVLQNDAERAAKLQVIENYERQELHDRWDGVGKTIFTGLSLVFQALIEEYDSRKNGT